MFFRGSCFWPIPILTSSHGSQDEVRIPQRLVKEGLLSSPQLEAKDEGSRLPLDFAKKIQQTFIAQLNELFTPSEKPLRYVRLHGFSIFPKSHATENPRVFFGAATYRRSPWPHGASLAVSPVVRVVASSWGMALVAAKAGMFVFSQPLQMIFLGMP